jgi:LytR cell envelope-related transcriptional attenuator
VVGLAILSALYFSQARDVKRLREWAGRAPERVVEAEAGGRPAAQPVPGRVTPVVSPAKPVGAGAPAAAAPGVVKTGAAAGAAAGAATGDGADAAPKPGAPAKPVPAGATAAAKDAAASEAEEAGAEDAVAAESEDETEKAGAPAAATPAGAAASGAAAGVPAVASAAGATAATTSERGSAATGGAAAGAGAPARRFGNGEGGEPRRDTQTGVKVLPAERAMPPVRRPPTLPRTGGQTAVLTEPPGSRPGGGRTGSRWPAPRYIALIVAGVIILGLGGVVGVMELTKKEDTQKSASNPPETDIGDPTREPDAPEPTRINPADVTVAVFNTTQTTGLASRISSRLQSAGFQPGNIAQAGQRQRAESVVMFKPGANDEARAVARKLGISQIEPIDQGSQALAGNAQVVVLLGADKASQ